MSVKWTGDLGEGTAREFRLEDGTRICLDEAGRKLRADDGSFVTEPCVLLKTRYQYRRGGFSRWALGGKHADKKAAKAAAEDNF